jgi:TonB family protein
MSSRYDDTPNVQLRFTWNPNAVKGFVAAVLVVSTIFLASMCTRLDPVKPYREKEYVPITLLVLGEGDGTGRRHGNASAEGAAQKGKVSPDPFQDASRPSASSTTNRPVADPSQSANLKPVKDVGRQGKDAKNDEAAEMTIGGLNGKEDGSGLGWAGSGKGKGLGDGDIDWGGGGNRIAVAKKQPKFPPGTLNTEVRLRFTVMPDGTISKIIPLTKSGNPAVEQAAMNALWQWRFNKLTTDVQMVGTIKFVFRNG